jgi:nitroimidazol reductase NimA-like FMN-containing flavoprotein (pyridoxamine 5'-phosphate oxidase superfamily)
MDHFRDARQVTDAVARTKPWLIPPRAADILTAMDENYHLRRIERDMPGRAEQLAVVRSQKFLSLAMSHENRPYLVAMNYAYSDEENCFYVHSAGDGRKIHHLRANPRVWGLIIEDRGYLLGRCSHSYRSVMFQARAEFVEEPESKLRALSLLIDHADPDPEPLKQRLVATPNASNVTVLRLVVESLSGKQGE